jgi:hypothetical protein
VTDNFIMFSASPPEPFLAALQAAGITVRDWEGRNPIDRACYIKLRVQVDPWQFVDRVIMLADEHGLKLAVGGVTRVD